MSRILVSRIFTLATIVTAVVISALGQQKPASRTVFFDSDGREVSNNEFVDIRMANSHYPDATVMKSLPDGTTEFRLQKIPQEGMTAPNFSVRTLDGKTVRLGDLRGKVVVLTFWFIGCPTCRALKPQLNQFKTKFTGQDDVVFLAMTGDSKSAVESYLKKEPFDYIQATDAEAAMTSFVFRTFPKNIVIDRTGKIVYWRGVVRAWDKFESVVRGELAKN
jgi:peroxiredoxin